MSRDITLSTALEAVGHRLTNARSELKQALADNNTGTIAFWREHVSRHEQAYQGLLELLREERRA